MDVSKTQCEIINGNPRKENGEDGNVLAYDISVEFAVPRAAIDALFPVKDFTDQFYSGDDTRLDVIFPITYGKKLEDLRISLHIGRNPMVFEGAKIARGFKITPEVGQYCKVECKLQVYPTEQQSGKLDQAVKEFIDLEIEPMTADMVAAA